MKERRHHNNTAEKRTREDKLYLSTQKIAGKLGIPYDPIKAVTESEADFLTWITGLARVKGWLYYHTWRSIHSPAGYPDLCLVKPPRIIFCELKTNTGKITDKQWEWIETLAECPQLEVYLFRPMDKDRIETIIT